MAKKSPNVWQKFWKRITDLWGQFLGTIDGLIGNKFVDFLNKTVPAPLRFLIPFLKDDLGIAPPSITSFRGIGIPEKDETKEILKEISVDQRVGTIWQIKPQFLRYQCQESNPFRCEFPHETVIDDPNNKYCKKCQFPASLPPEVKVRGRGGVYQVDNYIGIRGSGRLYNATNLTDGEPFLLKEYVIPKKYFNDQETRACKRNFEASSELKLSDGRKQDSRLITPIEAIADVREERCYAILPKTDEALTLSDYLDMNGAMSNWQVKSFLNQALQTLESLHSQKYRLRSGVVTSGLPHGNLTFYSIAIRSNFQGFTVYLNDMALWEDRFYPPDVQTPAYSINRDLEDLGYIAFYLLKGGVIDLENRSCLNPYDPDHWGSRVHLGLKKFVQNLLGFGETTYSSAEVARRALLRLHIERDALLEFIDQEEVEPVKKNWWGWLTKKVIAIAIGIILLLLLAFLLYFWLTQPQKAANLNFPCCINQISDIPEGKFTYISDKNGTWNYTLLQNNLIAKGSTLEDELQKRQPKLQLSYQPVNVDRNADQSPISQLLSNQADFAISSVTDNLGGNFITQNIAYDGLTVFVAFSYAQRNNSLPTSLEGRLTFAQLRQLYTGEIINWRQLGGPDLPVKLYMPLDDESVKIFEKRVLKDETAIAAFRQLSKDGNNGITSLSIFDSLRQVIQDFEDRNIGSISFGSISQVFGQCSVYPLAIADDYRSFVAPLVWTNGAPITPNADLCNEKGSYSQNYNAFINLNYPLAYPISVVYTRDNRRLPIAERFVSIMRTEEAQHLLKQTGLIPLKSPIK
ncbi:ABC-type phosphate transport system, periplasmic component [Pseudanabaena sp. lw0831]|uniref:substrate-binding domain-containing protein n=1 Tax=Pseudanabaena sp. lw0831 TaxID=1357935 RepID=UPI0019155B30|nr:substrate-binding domain-containing protein [Pseudanabaena sp. lw0831]GBO53276.1 ABC-type phosphate transport system, periplasmic component [Pseudanabaena sp. lw0831]